MQYTMDQYRESARAIQARLGGFIPKVAMILGSGLGYLGDQVETPTAIPYGEIPHFKASTAPGHKGRLGPQAAGVRLPGGAAGSRYAGTDAPLRGLLL